jgi:hypothetical protein
VALPLALTPTAPATESEPASNIATLSSRPASQYQADQVKRSA